MTDPLQAFLGIKIQTLLAAFFGGAASALFHGGGILLRMSAFFIGMMTAIYGTPFTMALVKDLTTVSGPDLERGAAFFTGMGGMVIVSGFYAALLQIREKCFEKLTRKSRQT